MSDPNPYKRKRGRPSKGDYAAKANSLSRQVYDERGDSAERILEVRQEQREAMFKDGEREGKLKVVTMYAAVVQETIQRLCERYDVPLAEQRYRDMLVITRSSSRDEILSKLQGYPDYIRRVYVGVSLISIAAYFLVGRATLVGLAEMHPEVFDPIMAIIQMRNEDLAEAAKNPGWYIYLSKNNFGAVRQFRDTQDIQISSNDRTADQKRLMDALRDVHYLGNPEASPSSDGDA